MENLKICVIGLGYIGLPTASLLATKGYQVHGVDVQKDVVETINQGKIHIVEPELDILVKSAVQSGNLKASLEPAEGDIFILSVPTPFQDNHVPDLHYVEEATKNIAPYLKPGNLVILESTSPVHTTEMVGKWLEEARGKSDDLFIAHCPERVLPGHILRELVENDRMVGGLTPEATKKVSKFYQSFVSGKILKTNARTAEMAKLVENSYRDVNIAFANELSMICENLNINVWELIKLANHHPRVNILNPGPGVGGHCIAVDPWFIVHKSPEESKLIKAARLVNDAKPEWVLSKVRKKAERFKSPVIACLGLSYKSNIDDLRESPSLQITQQLLKEGIGTVIACEPNVQREEIYGISLCSVEEAVEQADILLFLVNHEEFYELDQGMLEEKIVIDTCGMFH